MTPRNASTERARVSLRAAASTPASQPAPPVSEHLLRRLGERPDLGRVGEAELAERRGRLDVVGLGQHVAEALDVGPRIGRLGAHRLLAALLRALGVAGAEPAYLGAEQGAVAARRRGGDRAHLG